MPEIYFFVTMSQYRTGKSVILETNRTGGMAMTVVKKRRRARVTREECVACGCCVKVCPFGAIQVAQGLYAWVDTDKCVGCGKCARECPASVICIEEAAE